MSLESNSSKIIILELGERYSKIGFAGQQEPICLPSIMVDSGNPIVNIRDFNFLYSLNRQKYYANEAVSLIGILRSQPIFKHEEKEEIFEYIKFILSLLVKERVYSGYSILLLHKMSLNDSEKLNYTDFFLTTMGFSRCALLQEDIAILTGLGNESAVLVDFGESSTRISSFYKHYPNIQANQESSMSCSLFSAELLKTIKQKLNVFEDQLFLPYLHNIKKGSFFVSQSVDEEYEQARQNPEKYSVRFDFPDNSIFSISLERFMIPELYFRPQIKDYHGENIAELIKNAINAWERDQIPDLLKKIIIYGGGARIPGLKDRLELELQKIFPSSLKIIVSDYPNIPELAWVCGSAVVSKNQIKNWQTKSEEGAR
jgi:actin-related protein